MEEKKCNLRYSTKGIIIVIAVLTVFSAVFTEFFVRSGFIDSLSGDLYSYYYSSFISSLYDGKDMDYNYSNVPDGLKYAIRSYKIDNFNKTKEYSEINSIDEDEGNSVNKDADKKFEDPVYRVSFLSNIDGIDIGTDPQKYKPNLNDKNTYIIKGFYKDGKLNITYNNKPLDKYNKECATIKKSLKSVYRSINAQQYGIEKINFVYYVDFLSNDYKDFINYYENSNIFLPGILIGSIISFVLMCAFVMVSNYKKLSNVRFAMGIKRFPVEIVFILCCLWFVPVISFSSDMQYYEKLSRLPFLAFEMFQVFFALIAIYYMIIAFKSLYNDGMNSFVINNSIIIRIIRGITNRFKKGIENDNIDLSDNSKRKVAYISIGLIIIGTVACAMFVNNFKFVIWVLWLVLVYIFYKSYLKVADDIDELTEASKKIKEGNYNISIDVKDSSLKELARNISTISNNLSGAIEDAVKSERMKTELITNVSHDLKTPLTAIINYSDLLNNNDILTEEEVKEYSKIIYDKSNKLKYLIEDLFEVSKASSGNIEINSEIIDIKLLIMQIAGEWEDKLEEKNIKIVSKFPQDSVMLSLDANKTSRVFDNLMSNIYKYAMSGTRVYIDLFKDSSNVLIEIKNISNYSLNITPQELVERFKRGDESRNTEGSGLGLSIASSFIEAQGGKFNIEIDGDLFKTIIKF